MDEMAIVAQSVAELMGLYRAETSLYYRGALKDAAELIEKQHRELEELRYLIGEVEQGDRIRDEELASWRSTAEAATAAERQACIEVAEDNRYRFDPHDYEARGWNKSCEAIAAAIRNRGTPPSSLMVRS